MINFKECSPQFTFLMFLFFFSWEGPLLIYFGAVEGDVIILLVGFITTICLWVLFGLNSFCELLENRGTLKNDYKN